MTLAIAPSLKVNIGGKYMSSVPDRVLSMMRDTKVPWGPVGYTVYKRTYSRHLDTYDDASPKEEYWQTLKRCLNGILQIGGAFTFREVEVLASYLINLKCNFSGRGLWQLGTENVDRIGGDSLQACWQIKVNEPVHPFCFTFEELMLGGGVGSSVRPEHVYEIPEVRYNIDVERVDTFDCDLIVTDNREGWGVLLRSILNSFFFTGKDIKYNVNCLRPKGARIRTFGGTASGSVDLVAGLAEIVKILKSRHGLKLRPIDCVDIQCILGMIVVAGNVRRSAELLVGSPRDRDFLLAKYWGDKRIMPRWRQQANLTVATSDLEELLPEFWLGYDPDENGEAQGESYGLYNWYLSENYGRMADPIKPGYNSKAIGPNPCGEIILESDEACNLGELYLTNLVNGTEFHTAAELMFKCLKTISCLPFLYDRTREVVGRNRRIGLGITGVMAAHHLRKTNIFDSVYEHLNVVDEEYSKLLGGVPLSIAKTTVKPSGTAAKLPIGCTPGANPAFSLYSILRVAFASDSPMLPVLIESGYRTEPKQNQDLSYDFNTIIVSFPVKYPDGTPTEEISAIEQLENVAMLQRHWSDNAVSSTIQYKADEVPAIKDWLYKNYATTLKSVAFCRHSGHGFVQAPNEAISKEEYDEYANSVKLIDNFGIGGDMDDTSIEGVECPGGTCGIK